MDKIFPLIMMIMSFCAGIVYIFTGAWKHAVYWLAASLITWSVTAMR